MCCNTVTANTGTVDSCLPLDEQPSGLFFQKTYNGGVRNTLDSTLIGTVDYLKDLVNNANDNLRLIPFMNLTEVVDIRDETTFYTDNLEVDHDPVTKPRKFTAERIQDATPQLLGELEKLYCSQNSAYVIGEKGGVFGQYFSDTLLSGYEIVKDSLVFGFVKKVQNGKSAHITVKFTMAKIQEDKDIRKFNASQIADKPLELKGLIGVTLVNVANNLVAKTINFDAQTIHGALGQLVLIEDFVDTEMTMTLNGSPETIVSAPQDEGNYTLTYTTVAIATDVVTIAISKDGYLVTTLTYTLLP